MRTLARILHGAVFCAAMAVIVQGQTQADTSRYDVIKLKNGQELVGRITDEDEKTVTVLFRGGEMVLPRRQIAEIVRAERAEVERQAVEDAHLGRYEERDEHFFLYYRGRRVGWREVSLRAAKRGAVVGYQFDSRTVFVAEDGDVELDVKASEFIDQGLQPVWFLVNESSPEGSTITEGVISKGHLRLETEGFGEQSTLEVLFPPETRLMMALRRELADKTHYPEKGESYKVFDVVERRFINVHATRTLRKEVVSGRHQFITSWRLERGDRAEEMWIDGYGGIVRQELGGAHMVALRSRRDDVVAFSNGDLSAGGESDLSLVFESVPDEFRLARPNLTWSYEFPEAESPHALALVNPTLQASVDVIVVNDIGAETAPETLVLDVLRRMGADNGDQRVLFQREETVGGVEGVRFEAVGDRKGVHLRTVGAVTTRKGRGYALLLAAPTWRFKEASPQLERILESFELTDRSKEQPDG